MRSWKWNEVMEMERGYGNGMRSWKWNEVMEVMMME